MLLIYTPWKHQNTFRLYNTYRIWVSSEGLIDCAHVNPLLSSLSIFSLSCYCFFLAKEEYKVRYDEKEREAKDLNEKVTVIFFVIVRKLRYE